MTSTQNLLEEPGFIQAAEIRRRRDNAEKWEELKNYMYNSKDGTIFKEDRINWGNKGFFCILTFGGHVSLWLTISMICVCLLGRK